MRMLAVPKSIPKSKFKDRFKRPIKSPTCSGRTKRFNVMAGVVLAMATVSRLRRSARRIFVTLTMASRILEAKWFACFATPSESFVDLRFVLRKGLRVALALEFSTFAAPRFCCSLYKAGPLERRLLFLLFCFGSVLLFVNPNNIST